jgi:hypothetical protein
MIDRQTIGRQTIGRQTIGRQTIGQQTIGRHFITSNFYNIEPQFFESSGTSTAIIFGKLESNFFPAILVPTYLLQAYF